MASRYTYEQIKSMADQPFKFEADRKRVLDALSNLYEYGYQKIAQSKWLDLSRTFQQKFDGSNYPDAIPGKEKEYERAHNAYYDIPYYLNQVKPKNMWMFSEWGMQADVQKLVDLRNEVKEKPLEAKKEDDKITFGSTSAKIDPMLKATRKQIEASLKAIGDATDPLKQEAMQAARDAVEEHAMALKATLKANAFNPFRVIPKPEGVWERAEADKKRAKYLRYVKRDSSPASWKANSADYDDYQWNEENVKRDQDMAADETRVHYESWVIKMVTKAPTTVVAKLHTDQDVWQYSVIRLTLEDGTEELWQTKAMWNTSKFGNQFIQWRSTKK